LPARHFRGAIGASGGGRMRIATVVAGLVLATATPVVALAQSAQPLYFDPALPSDFVAPTPFEGLYAGVLLGAISARKNNFNVGGEDIRPEFGAVVGWNQPVAPGVVLGGELQATVATDISTTYMRAMALARLGFAAGDNTLIYALGGLGVVGAGTAFAVGIRHDARVAPHVALD